MNNAPADQHYYYDTSNMDEKLRYVEEAHKKRSPQFSFYLQQKIGATGFEPATSRLSAFSKNRINTGFAESKKCGYTVGYTRIIGKERRRLSSFAKAI